MPWSPAQHRLFEAAEHNPEVAKRTGIPQAKAAQMASEGIKGRDKAKKRHDPKKLGEMLRRT